MFDVSSCQSVGTTNSSSTGMQDPLLGLLSIQSNTPPSHIDRIKTLCCPLLEEIHSNHPSFKWAGIFGPVNRNTESSNSNVNIVIGFSPDADFFDDLDEGLDLLENRLPEVLGVGVGVAGFIQQTETTQYVDMGALLTARTIWGDDSWLDINRGVALELLQRGYAKIKEADDLMSNAQRTLSAIQVLIAKVASSAVTDQMRCIRQN